MKAWQAIHATSVERSFVCANTTKQFRALQDAIHLRPEYAIAWFNLGVVYSAQGDHSEVMTVYEKLKTLDQNLADDSFRKMVLP